MKTIKVNRDFRIETKPATAAAQAVASDMQLCIDAQSQPQIEAGTV